MRSAARGALDARDQLELAEIAQPRFGHRMPPRRA
jgi:hypothetical protein